MPVWVTQLLKFLASAFGFVLDTKRDNKRTKGLEAENAILKDQIERGDRTNEIEEDTVKVNEEGLPSFDYSNYR